MLFLISALTTSRVFVNAAIWPSNEFKRSLTKLNFGLFSVRSIIDKLWISRKIWDFLELRNFDFILLLRLGDTVCAPSKTMVQGLPAPSKISLACLNGMSHTLSPLIWRILSPGVMIPLVCAADSSPSARGNKRVTSIPFAFLSLPPPLLLLPDSSTKLLPTWIPKKSLWNVNS